MCSAQGWDLSLWPSRCYDNTTEWRQALTKILNSLTSFLRYPNISEECPVMKNFILSRKFSGKLWLLEFFFLLSQSLRLVFFLLFWFYRTWVRVLKSNCFVIYLDQILYALLILYLSLIWTDPFIFCFHVT